MRCRVDTERTSRADREPRFAKSRRESCCQINPDRGTTPGTDHGDDRILIDGRTRPPNPQHHRWIINPLKRRGIIVIEDRQHGSAESFDPPKIRVRVFSIERSHPGRDDHFALSRDRRNGRNWRRQNAVDGSEKLPQL